MVKRLPNLLLALLALLSIITCAYFTLYQERVQLYTEEEETVEDSVEEETELEDESSVDEPL